jgi:DNA modification methylase
MVQVFEECYRVLRPDGTLWLNIGDTHAGSGRGANKKKGQAKENYVPDPTEVIRYTSDTIQATELMGIPWALAFALRANGWYLKEEIIWHKRNPRPESVTNRPCRDHEQVFLLSKSQKYFYDGEAVKEPTSPKTNTKGTRLAPPKEQNGVSEQGQKDWTSSTPHRLPTRNLRTVWSMLSEQYKGQHFATFPSKLAETCILAGTSAYGVCAECGAPYERETEIVGYDMQSYAPETRKYHIQSTGDKHGKNSVMNTGLVPIKKTVGWHKTCDCEESEVVPAIVLDPFNGSGRTILAANRHGRYGVGVELNPYYIEQAKKQLSTVQMALSGMFGEG